MLHFFIFFHLNLAYSSIEEDQRNCVIEKCYWPILNLADKLRVPVGIEASGYTLEQIYKLDPAWILKLKDLQSRGLGELIGCGYAQLIGPLVPAAVNQANLRIGHRVYENLLGKRPRVALVNEQAWSAGLISHYLEANYNAIIMEWNNPAGAHPEWHKEWAFLPQLVCGVDNETLPVIWNNSVAFQKFQRYAHGEMDLDEYLAYLNLQQSCEERVFPLYGNDAEVFDFRPGRFHTETLLNAEVEWRRIEALLQSLKNTPGFDLILPSAVLEFITRPNAGNALRLESAEQPIPVKKQNKYNITRWAVTGRDDLGINTACWQIYSKLKQKAETPDSDWQELCYLWSSDFRTHITQTRWDAYIKRLYSFRNRLDDQVVFQKEVAKSPLQVSNEIKVGQDNKYLTVESQFCKVELNRRRGLAVNRLWFKTLGDRHLLGTLEHGFYEDISLAADFYTGHFVFEIPGYPRITDLNPVEPEIRYFDNYCEVACEVSTLIRPVKKYIRVYYTPAKIEWEYEFDWPALPGCIMRFANFTLNPEAFDRNSLFYKSKNGGHKAETFELDGTPVDHSAPVSFMVSANHVLGLTDGLLEFGERERRLQIFIDKSKSSLAGMVKYKRLQNSFFYRLMLSAREMDETNQLQKAPGIPFARVIRFAIKAE